MNDEDTTYLVERLRRVVELLKGGEVHMAIAKLNADISALAAPDSERGGGNPYDPCGPPQAPVGEACSEPASAEKGLDVLEHLQWSKVAPLTWRRSDGRAEIYCEMKNRAYWVYVEGNPVYSMSLTNIGFRHAIEMVDKDFPWWGPDFQQDISHTSDEGGVPDIARELACRAEELLRIMADPEAMAYDGATTRSAARNTLEKYYDFTDVPQSGQDKK